jgi:hypothetical protein
MQEANLLTTLTVFWSYKSNKKPVEKNSRKKPVGQKTVGQKTVGQKISRTKNTVGQHLVGETAPDRIPLHFIVITFLPKSVPEKGNKSCSIKSIYIGSKSKRKIPDFFFATKKRRPFTWIWVCRGQF